MESGQPDMPDVRQGRVQDRRDLLGEEHWAEDKLQEMEVKMDIKKHKRLNRLAGQPGEEAGMKVCAIHYMFADYDECPHCVIEERDRLREELKAREDEHKAAYYQSYENFWTILNLREERDRLREDLRLAKVEILRLQNNEEARKQRSARSLRNRLGGKPLTEEEKRANLEYNLTQLGLG